MDSAILGILLLLGVVHTLLVIIPIRDTLKADISSASKFAWCAFLVFVPLLGAAFFHSRFRSSLFQGKPYEPSAHDLGVRNPGFKDKDRQ